MNDASRVEPSAGVQAALKLGFPGGFSLDVALDLPARGISALFGPSGCGKTTVLRALAGLERAAGHVRVGAEAWQDDARGVFVPTHRRALGYVFQEPSLFPHLDVRRNLAYGWRRIPQALRRVQQDQAVELLGIAHLLERMPDKLSGGEKQRVAIARALLTSPSLLLMDEPLAAVDAARKAEILPYLERLHDELALPVVYVSHSIEEVARLADHLVLMDAGRIVAEGPLVPMLARLDLPHQQLDDAATVVEASVDGHDADYGLTRIAFPGGAMWVGAATASTGLRVRARVLARDVSITLEAARDTSILNVLPARVQAMRDEGADRVLVQLLLDDGSAGTGTLLLARITRRSRDQLALAPGLRVWAQVKGVALMRS